MSEIKERILNDMKEAMKSKDNFKRDTLRMISSMFKQIEVDERRELSDDDVIAILKRACKQREEAAIQYRNGGREDLCDKEHGEIEIIMLYLPKQLDDVALRNELKGVISEIQASSMKDMGRVMSIASERFSRVADGKRMSNMVKELLSTP